MNLLQYYFTLPVNDCFWSMSETAPLRTVRSLTRVTSSGYCGYRKKINVLKEPHFQVL
jgi:hypothetical protein